MSGTQYTFTDKVIRQWMGSSRFRASASISVAALLLVSFGGGYLAGLPAVEHTAAQTETTTVAPPPETTTPVPTTSSTPPPPPPPPPSPPPPVPQHVPASPALEMQIPSIDLRANFEDEPCRLVNDAIDPVHLNLACTFTSPDYPYSLPGTDADDIAVIAGHTGAGFPAVFNKLYDGSADEHQVKIGDVLYVRTEASGDNWLRYRATDLHSPEKEGLSTSAEIWGTEPMPGRLLTISCVQPANLLAPAVRNAVVGWQLEGVAGPEEVEAAS